MDNPGTKPVLEIGMKVSVKRSGRDRIGVVTRIEGDYVVLRWTVIVLAGWL